MPKCLKNNYLICLSLLLSSFFMTFLLCSKTYDNLTFKCLFINGLFVLLTILITVTCESLFLLAIDSLICNDQKFVKRFLYTFKSLWLSQCILLPISLFLMLFNGFVNLNLTTVNKILIFSMSYLSQVALLFAYKFVTARDWSTSIKIVSANCCLIFFLSQLIKFI